MTKQIDDQSKLELDSLTMAKCTKSCLMSMKEDSLLPTEKKCLRNCFIKSIDFNSMFAEETAYQLRNLEKASNIL